MVSTWEAWKLIGGSPSPGSVEEQPARQIAAFGILSSEMDLIQSHFAERAESRAKQTR